MAHSVERTSATEVDEPSWLQSVCRISTFKSERRRLMRLFATYIRRACNLVNLGAHIALSAVSSEHFRQFVCPHLHSRVGILTISLRCLDLLGYHLRAALRASKPINSIRALLTAGLSRLSVGSVLGASVRCFTGHFDHARPDGIWSTPQVRSTILAAAVLPESSARKASAPSDNARSSLQASAPSRPAIRAPTVSMKSVGV